MLYGADNKPLRKNDVKGEAPAGTKLLMKGCAFIMQGLQMGTFLKEDLVANRDLLQKALDATNDLIEGIEQAEKQGPPSEN